MVFSLSTNYVEHLYLLVAYSLEMGLPVEGIHLKVSMFVIFNTDGGASGNVGKNDA